MYILNAFSVAMVPDGAVVQIDPIGVEEARSMARGRESAVGHADTARIFSEILGRDIPTNRVSVTLLPGAYALLGQYSGPRLPEGATTLPAGAELRWYAVSVSALPRRSDGIPVVSEAERSAIEAELEGLGATGTPDGRTGPLAEGSSGGSPYSPQTVVYGTRGVGRGTRVTITPVARSHNGAGAYKGRGRWREVILLTPADDGAQAICDPTDHGAQQVGHADLWTRPWDTHAAEAQAGGLGPRGSAALAAALAKAGLTEDAEDAEDDNTGLTRRPGSPRYVAALLPRKN